MIKNINHIIGLSIISIVFCLELRFAVRDARKLKRGDHNIRIHVMLLVLPLCIYLGNMLSIVCGPMADWAPWTLDCLLWCQIAIVLWLTNKCLLYILLIMRLHMVYDNSTFAIAPRKLFLFALTVLLYTFVMAVVAPLVTKVTVIPFHDMEGVICEMNVSFLFLCIAATVDIAVSFLTLYLFIKPLHLLQKKYDANELSAATSVQTSRHRELSTSRSNMSTSNKALSDVADRSNSVVARPRSPSSPRDRASIAKSRRSQQKKGDKSLYRVMVKYCTLTVMMVLSTCLILMVIGVFDTISVGTVDVTLNCICIAFFQQAYDAWFGRVCCGGILITKWVSRHCMEFDCSCNCLCKRKMQTQNLEHDLADLHAHNTTSNTTNLQLTANQNKPTSSPSMHSVAEPVSDVMTARTLDCDIETEENIDAMTPEPEPLAPDPIEVVPEDHGVCMEESRETP